MASDIRTWADGFGNWHARVPVGSKARRRAREAIRAEIALRSTGLVLLRRPAGSQRRRQVVALEGEGPMRTIDITKNDTVEIWPGRRLLAGELLIQLPKGCVDVLQGKTNSSLSFGSPARTTVMITGRRVHVELIRRAIIEMERPEGAKTV